MAGRKLDRETLIQNGIRYDAKPATYAELSQKYAEVALVLEGLLDFDGVLPESCYNELDKDSQRLIQNNFPTSRIPPPAKTSPRRVERYQKQHRIAYSEERFELAQDLAQEAANIEVAKEVRWSELIKDYLFGRLIQLARNAEGERHFKARNVIETIRVESEDIWDCARVALRGTTPRVSPKLTSPKVDLYIALPVISSSSNSKGFYKDDYVQNFHENRLAALSDCGLISCPIKDLNSNKISAHHLVCFPSAIVEIKHHCASRSEQEKCFVQAANASSSALAMLNQLSRYSRGDLSLARIRPIVSFTFIGPQCKVWLTYIRWKGRKSREREMCRYVMQHIWKGDLRNVWDSVQLCCIIENLHYWTLRHFRPWVSSCLDRWYLEFDITGDNTQLREDEASTEPDEDKDNPDSNEDEVNPESSDDDDNTESSDDEDDTESNDDEDDTEASNGKAEMEPSKDEVSTESSKDENRESNKDENSTSGVRKKKPKSGQDNQGRQASREDQAESENDGSGADDETETGERQSDKTERSCKLTSGLKLKNRDFAGDDDRDELGTRGSLKKQSPTPCRKSLPEDRDTTVSSSEISIRASTSPPVRRTPDGRSVKIRLPVAQESTRPSSRSEVDTSGSPNRQGDTTPKSVMERTAGEERVLRSPLSFSSQPESPFGSKQNQSSISGSGGKVRQDNDQNALLESTHGRTALSFESEPRSEQDQKGIPGSTTNQGFDHLWESQRPTSLGFTSKSDQDQTSVFSTDETQDWRSAFVPRLNKGQDTHSKSTRDKKPLSWEFDPKGIVGSTSKQMSTSTWGFTSKSSPGQTSDFSTGPKQDPNAMFGSESKPGQNAHSEPAQDQPPHLFGAKSESEQDQKASL